MLSNAFEWERLIHPNPTDEMITRRKAIVTDMLTSFDSNQDVGDLLRLVSSALGGLSPEVSADVEYAKVLTEATKKHHQAFPTLLSESALDLQLTACLAVGEILSRSPTDQTWDEPQLAVASLCLSTAGLRTTGGGLHLTSVQESLKVASRDLLVQSAKEVRRRPEYSSAVLEKLSPPGDIPSFWNQLRPILNKAFTALSTASAIDRDELEVLWWLYNSESSTFSKPLSELGAYDVALAGSIELVDRALCPAPISLNGIVRGLVAGVSNKASSAGKSLKAVIGAWGPEISRTIIPPDDATSGLVAACPKTLPLTWIAKRIADSGVSQGWEQEFGSKTGLSANSKITPQALADQVFVERTAQRLLSQLAGE